MWSNKTHVHLRAHNYRAAKMMGDRRAAMRDVLSPMDGDGCGAAAFIDSAAVGQSVQQDALHVGEVVGMFNNLQQDRGDKTLLTVCVQRIYRVLQDPVAKCHALKALGLLTLELITAARLSSVDVAKRIALERAIDDALKSCPLLTQYCSVRDEYVLSATPDDARNVRVDLASGVTKSRVEAPKYAAKLNKVTLGQRTLQHTSIFRSAVRVMRRLQNGYGAKDGDRAKKRFVAKVWIALGDIRATWQQSDASARFVAARRPTVHDSSDEAVESVTTAGAHAFDETDESITAACAHAFDKARIMAWLHVIDAVTSPSSLSDADLFKHCNQAFTASAMVCCMAYYEPSREAYQWSASLHRLACMFYSAHDMAHCSPQHCAFYEQRTVRTLATKRFVVHITELAPRVQSFFKNFAENASDRKWWKNPFAVAFGVPRDNVQYDPVGKNVVVITTRFKPRSAAASDPTAGTRGDDWRVKGVQEVNLLWGLHNGQESAVHKMLIALRDSLLPGLDRSNVYQWMHETLSRPRNDQRESLSSIYDDVSLCMLEGFLRPFAGLETRAMREDETVHGYSFVWTGADSFSNVYYRPAGLGEAPWTRPGVQPDFRSDGVHFTHPGSDRVDKLRAMYGTTVDYGAIRTDDLKAPPLCAVVLSMNTVFALGARAANDDDSSANVLLQSTLMHLQGIRFLASVQPMPSLPPALDDAAMRALQMYIVDAAALYYNVILLGNAHET